MYVRKCSSRFCLPFIILIVFLLAFIGNLIWIQCFRSGHLAALAEKQHNYGVKLEPRRGTIYDRKLRPLAMNVPVYSLFANPRRMGKEEKDRAVAELSRILSLDRDDIRKRLSRDKYFVWLQRKMSEEAADEVRALKIPALDFIKESKRHYPNQSLAAHVIGFAGVDNQGLEGLELSFNEYLKGEYGWSRILRDAKQRELLIEKETIPPQDGFSLVLTIDETIQYIAETALDQAFQKHHAASASIIVMDPYTGEILAFANRPTYDLSDFMKSPLENRTNRGVAYLYEPGSVFKIVAAAAALEDEIFNEKDRIYCEKGEYRVGNHILHDHHAQATLTFSEVIEQSSNIGTTKIAQKMGADVFYKYAQRFRFGELSGIDLVGEVAGVLKPPAQWSKTTIGAIPIGHEVLVTPLQLVCAISSIANGGIYMKPFVVKYIKDRHDELIRAFEPQVIDRVISEETAKRLTAILQKAVENGTGKKAQIRGVNVAGKTGTAQKVVNGIYSHNKFYASFIGFAPAEDPRVAAVVVLDEPHPSYYGGTVAAPVFQEVISAILQYIEADELMRE